MESQTNPRVLVLKTGGCFEEGLGVMLGEQPGWQVFSLDYADHANLEFVLASLRPHAILVNESGAVDIPRLMDNLASLRAARPLVIAVREADCLVTVYDRGQRRQVRCASVADFRALFQAAWAVA